MRPIYTQLVSNMRFDLKVPYAEKDAAKALGARWDAARKIWYVTEVDDIAPFSKWSPVAQESTSVPQKKAPAQTQGSGKVYVGSSYVEHVRVCECLPWEVCDTCLPTALPYRSLAKPV